MYYCSQKAEFCRGVMPAGCKMAILKINNYFENIVDFEKKRVKKGV